MLREILTSLFVLYFGAQGVVFSEGVQERFLATKSKFPARSGSQVARERGYEGVSDRTWTETDDLVGDSVFAIHATSLLKGRLTVEGFEQTVRRLELVDTYRIEGIHGPIEAVRYRSHDGKWSRIGRTALGRSDPEMGFLIRHKRPESGPQLEGLWIESFEKTVPVEVLIPGTTLGVVIKTDVTDFLAHEPKIEMDVDEIAEQENIRSMEEEVLGRYRELVHHSSGEKRKLYDAEQLLVLSLLSKIKKGVSSTVSARESLLQVLKASLTKYTELLGKNRGQEASVERMLDGTIAAVSGAGQVMLDILDHTDRLAALAEKIRRVAENGQKAILVGKILVSHFEVIQRRAVGGIITDEKQFKNGHMMPLVKQAGLCFARSTGDVPSLVRELKEGDVVSLEMLDTDKANVATITLEPTAEQRFNILRKTVERERYREAVSRLKSRTRDNHSASLYLNVAVHEELPWHRGEFTHLGLVRSDYTYMQADTAPSLEDLTGEYSRFFERTSRAGVREINFRTFDLDLGDKAPPYFTNEKKREGLDFSLSDPQGVRAFRIQVEAIFKGLVRGVEKGGSPRKLNLLFPKVKDVEEYNRASSIVHEIYEELRDREPDYDYGAVELSIGVMLETKEALEKVEQFVGQVDFINVGTNDLTLSLFRDRVFRLEPEKGKVPISEYYPRVLEAVVRIVNAAKANPNPQRRTPVCVCGDLASLPEFGLFLVGLGYSKLSLSMPYEQVLDMKVNIAAHEFDVIRHYTEEVLRGIKRCARLKGQDAEKAYGDLRELMHRKRAETERSTLEYLLYDWGTLSLSFTQVLQVLNRVYGVLSRMGPKDPSEQRKEIADSLLEQGILTPRLYEKVMRSLWDVEELLGVLQVWAYGKLINQGDFHVYRAKKIGRYHWIRVLHTGEEYNWTSRYDRRLSKDESGRMWIQVGPGDRRVPAEKVSSMEVEEQFQESPDAEIYQYTDRGETHYVRNLNDRGVVYTFVRAGPEKGHVISLFRSGRTNREDEEKLYRDEAGKVRIVHVPDWTKHPVFKDLPYRGARLTQSALFFLLDAQGDELTWGQNLARPGYGNLFEDSSRVLEMLINRFRVLDQAIAAGREKLGVMKVLTEVTRSLAEERSHRERLEKALRDMGINPERIGEYVVVERAA